MEDTDVLYTLIKKMEVEDFLGGPTVLKRSYPGLEMTQEEAVIENLYGPSFELAYILCFFRREAWS